MTAPRLTIVCMLLALLGRASFAGEAYTLIPLTLGADSTAARAISEAGLVAGIRGGFPSTVAAWLPDGTLINGPGIGGFSQEYNGVNDLEQFVGTSDGHAFTGVWNGNAFDLQPFLPGGITTSQGSDVNNAGLVLVRGRGNTGPEQSFIFDGVSMTQLAPPSGSPSASALALNDAGRAAGYATLGGQGDGLATVWNGTQPTVLPPLPGRTFAAAIDINNLNQVVGYSFNSGGAHRAVRWDGNQVLDLGSLPGTFSHHRAYGLNDAGQIVGAAYLPSGDSRAFIWEDGIMRNLNDLIPAGSGWTLREAFAINEQGWIVGQGRAPGGGLRGFLLVPEPSSAMAAALLLFANRRLAHDLDGLVIVALQLAGTDSPGTSDNASSASGFGQVLTARNHGRALVRRD